MTKEPDKSITALDWVTAGAGIITGMATLGAVIVALLIAFGRIRATADLEVYLDPHPPDSHQILTTIEGEQPDLPFIRSVQTQSYYCRLRVRNQGRAEAEGVEVQMFALRKRGAAGTFEPDPIFLPLDLQWSFGETQRPRLLPDLERYCDLVHIDRLPSSTQVSRLIFHNAGYPTAPNALKEAEWPTQKPPGEYELDIAVAATNARTIRRTISINFTGEWYDDEKEMFAQGLIVQVQRPTPRAPRGH